MSTKGEEVLPHRRNPWLLGLVFTIDLEKEKVKVPFLYLFHVNKKKFYRPPGSDPPGCQLPSGGQFSVFLGMILVFCQVFLLIQAQLVILG